MLASLAVALLAPVPIDRDYHERLNGTTLHFRVRGADPRNPYLVILHGGPGFSSHMFLPWGRSVEGRLNVVYLDQRGSGESERLRFKSPYAPTPEEARGYTVDALVEDVEAVRAFLKVPRWFVLGHSWGGMLGLEYVVRHPEAARGYIHVDGLLSQPMAQDAIVATAARTIAKDEASGDPKLQAQAKELKPYLPYFAGLRPGPTRMMSAMQFARALFDATYYADPAKGRADNERNADALKAYGQPLSVAAPASEPGLALVLTSGYATRDETPLLPRVRTRTLVVNGREDGLIPPGTAETVARGIPRARLEILDDCGHFPFAEQPERFTRLVLAFARRG